MDAKNPLTDQDAVDIDRALSDLKEADELGSLAEQAGIDVGSRRQTIRDNRDKLLRIKQTFFPNR